MIFFLFNFGLCVGSFLNVLIYRLPNELSPLKGRSFCPQCKHQLAWKDNLPLLSFFWLRAKCRYCHSPISWQYPVVEMTTGILFLLIGLGFFRELGRLEMLRGSLIGLGYLLFIISSLIVIFFADLKYQIIPDKIVYPAMIIAGIFNSSAKGGPRFAGQFLISNQFSRLSSLGSEAIGGQAIFNYLLAGLGAGGFFLTLFLLTRGKGMGFGDVKLAFLMGLILGFPKIMVALYLSFLTGALVGVILILLKKKRFGQHIPFGPFLVGGTFVSMFYGNQILEWFLKILN
ncbi:prepilin peptidase [Candidatus Microgenomates bacterium]|nr:prepilin peptidase [Candidatus Microgenomates bacterium]